MLYLFVGRYLLPLNVFYTADKCSSLCIHTACYLNGSYAIFTRPNTPQPLNSPPPNHICYVCVRMVNKTQSKTKDTFFPTILCLEMLINFTLVPLPLF